MHSQAKKMAVLNQLREETEALSLNELLEKLGKEAANRSVRRWLSDMVKTGLVKKLGSKRGTKYRVMEQANRYNGTVSSCFGPESEKIVKRVRSPIYEREPVSYVEDWLNSYQPNMTFYIPPSLRAQLHQAGKRSHLEDPAGTYARQIFNRLLIDLSYNSSRLEGNTYSLLDTQKLVLEGAIAEGKLDEEKVMILNHKEAIRYLVDTAPRLKVDKEVICTLHYLLSDELLEKSYAGKVRDHGVRIGGSTYIPFEDPKQLQIHLVLITEKAALIKDPYEQSLFLLVHITYLQAFADVNKRTARLSANIPLIKNNLVPLSFNDVEREDYTSAVIAVYELQNIRPLLDLYIFSYMRTCAMYNSTVKSIGFDEIRVRTRSQRRSIIHDIIVNKMVGKAMNDYASSQMLKLIKQGDQESFLKNILEDLEDMDEIRIAGLGVTKEQLKKWRDAQ